jgi:Mrp family chromosome partitioning ATPase/capsular polysaccharide biosynthesis protein
VTLRSERRSEDSGTGGPHRPADWIGQVPPSEGLRLYLDIVRSRIWVVAIIVLFAVGAAAVFVMSADKVYRAEADMLITPVPADNPNLLGLGLVSESGDPTRDAETLAQLITTPSVAERVRADLRLTDTPLSILSQVSAKPVAQSAIVTITAEADTPTGAARLANSFARGAIADRTARLHATLDVIIPRVRRDLAALPAGDAAAREALSGRLRDLSTLRAQPDPTMHLETNAVPSDTPVSPRPVLTLAAALIGGLVLGFGALLAGAVLDPRIDREDDLRRYRIPILARIPVERGRARPGRRTPLTPDQLSGSAREAFRRLGSSLAARVDVHGKHAIFVTGAAPTDGKTTTALNLSAALATMNERVALIEADFRRPSLGPALNLKNSRGVATVLAGQTRVSEAVEQAVRLHAPVRILAHEADASSAPPHISPQAAQALIRGAEEIADWVVFDGPALNYAAESLPIAKEADSVVLVVRLRRTRTRDLADLAELLSQQGIVPAGFIVVGGGRQPTYY